MSHHPTVNEKERFCVLEGTLFELKLKKMVAKA